MKPATNRLAGRAKISCGRRDLFDLAGAHHRDAIGHGQRLQLIVGHDHGRLVEACQHFLDLSAHRLAQLHVQARERLVEQKTDRIANDRAADRDPLLFAFGQLAGQPVEKALELEHARDLGDPARALGTADPLRVQGILQVLAHAQAGVQRVELKGHGDVALARGELVDPPAGEPDLAVGRELQTGDHAQGSGLAAARGAEQAHHLARLDREVDGVDRHQLIEPLGGLLELDVGHDYRLTSENL